MYKNFAKVIQTVPSRINISLQINPNLTCIPIHNQHIYNHKSKHTRTETHLYHMNLPVQISKQVGFPRFGSMLDLYDNSIQFISSTQFIIFYHIHGSVQYHFVTPQNPTQKFQLESGGYIGHQNGPNKKMIEILTLFFKSHFLFMLKKLITHPTHIYKY